MIQCFRYDCPKKYKNVNNCRFTEFFDRYFHIVGKHEFGLPFHFRNLPTKFCINPSTNVLVIMVTDRHRHTNQRR